MFVHQTIKELQRKKVHAIFIKLDISKPFDTVNWSYLLDIMTFLGFGLRWRNWISAVGYFFLYFLSQCGAQEEDLS
jgi:hypothetical protein